MASAACVAYQDYFAEVAQIGARNGLELRKKRFADDGYTSAGIVEDVFVIVRLGLGVDGDGHGANFYGAEEGIQEFGGVEQKENNALFGTDAEILQGVACAVGALKKLLVGDTLVSAFDGDVLRATLQDVAVDEVGGDVEDLGQRDHAAAFSVDDSRKCEARNILARATG